jgi:hypothetical protein
MNILPGLDPAIFSCFAAASNRQMMSIAPAGGRLARRAVELVYWDRV